uniref:Uncharacterized protein n=1 Tax=Arundo donax TaxID=35708 RepID=A0A0A9E0G5_ARUDO
MPWMPLSSHTFLTMPDFRSMLNNHPSFVPTKKTPIPCAKPTKSSEMESASTESSFSSSMTLIRAHPTSPPGPASIDQRESLCSSSLATCSPPSSIVMSAVKFPNEPGGW